MTPLKAYLLFMTVFTLIAVWVRAREGRWLEAVGWALFASVSALMATVVWDLIS